jgi:hypothetical protein
MTQLRDLQLSRYFWHGKYAPPPNLEQLNLKKKEEIH